MLGAGERSVQEIADALPISRPAVSRHLRLLKSAGLVSETPMGTRRIYQLHAQGAEAVQAYVERVWGEAAARFRLVASNTNREAPQAVIEPIRLSFEVACPVDHAFDVWTADIGRWWPKDHTVSAEADLTVVLEPRAGGRIFERRASGIEHDWGEVTVWEPPKRLGYTWHLNRDRSDATDVEIRFLPVGGAATRVEIEHRGWERLGAEGEPWRDRNRGGWATLLPHYVRAAAED